MPRTKLRILSWLGAFIFASALLPGSSDAACCTGMSYCSGFSYSTCSSDSSCVWTCGVPTPTQSYNPTPTRVPNTTPTVCSLGQSKCVGTQRYECGNNKWVTAIDSSSCGSRKCCIGASYCGSLSENTCKSDTSCYWTCSNSPITPTPTPKPDENFYQCVNRYSLAYCTQTNPLWANSLLPYCYDDSGKYVANSYTVGQRGCGQSSTCSLLCTCHKNETYCNVKNCINSVSEYQNASCRGTGPDLNSKIVNKYGSACYTANQLTPDSNGTFSKSSLKAALAYGPVQVMGTFKDKVTGKVYSHNSTIVSIKDGMFIFNDSYFNSENPDASAKTTSPFLEDKYIITITSASSNLQK